MGKKHNIYWYPGKDHILGDLLLCSLDQSHLLTNLQTAITQKGALGVKPEDYRVMCEAKVLHMVTIQDNLDQQNVSIAKEIFSEKVEKCSKDNNKMHAAYVIGIIHRCYEACDEWGLLATRRAKRLQDMSDLLLKEIDFTQFPPPGNNVAGVSISTYEGILQCNTLHILLYSLSAKRTYNHRSISTLAADSFFFRPDSSGIYSNQHDPEKFFFMELTSKSVYPCNVMDLTEDMDPLEDTGDVAYFKNYLFDKQVMRSTHRKEGKKFKINEPDKTAQGTHGV